MKSGGKIDACYMITADEAALLERAGLHSLRTRIRGNDERVDRILLGLRELALTVIQPTFVRDFRAVENAKADTGSDHWITPAQAARQLGVTPAAVRQAAREGRLQAECIEGRWRIQEEDIRIWKAARAA